jgi:hypothetical protein
MPPTATSLTSSTSSSQPRQVHRGSVLLWAMSITLASGARYSWLLRSPMGWHGPVLACALRCRRQRLTPCRRCRKGCVPCWPSPPPRRRPTRAAGPPRSSGTATAPSACAMTPAYGCTAAAAPTWSGGSPELGGLHHALSGHEVVLDGEVVAIGSDDRPAVGRASRAPGGTPLDRLAKAAQLSPRRVRGRRLGARPRRRGRAAGRRPGPPDRAAAIRRPHRSRTACPDPPAAGGAARRLRHAAYRGERHHGGLLRRCPTCGDG